MKKILSIVALSALMGTASYADIARVEMGAGAWMQTPSGSADYTAVSGGGSDTMDKTQKTSTYVWALVKHPIPVVPNLRAEYTNISSTGVASGTWGSVTGGGNSSLDMQQIDVVPYYNILDNTFWTTLDLGIDVKIVDLDFKVDGASSTYEYKKSLLIPMGYARARVQIPTTGIGLEADVKYVAYGSSTFSDTRAKVDYTFKSFPIVQPAVEVGYRAQKLKIDASSADIKTDIDFSGFYAGLMLRF
jgi:outer membrane protein